MRARALVLIFALVLLAEAATAATYYVRTGGDDAADGLSPATAWQTIDHAGDTLVAGDVVYIGAGTYTDKVDVQNSGTAAAPIRFVADATGAFTGDAGSVVLDPGGDAFKIDGESYITVVGLEVASGNNGYKVKDAAGVRIESCLVRDAKQAIEIDAAEVVIQDCEFRDNTDHGASIKKDSIVDITDLVVRGSGKAGFKIDGDASVTSARRCDVHSNGDEGVELKKGTASFVNCVVRDNGKDGFKTDDDDASLTLWHTSIVDNAASGVWVKKGAASVRNSILATNGGWAFDNEDALVHEYNLLWSNTSGSYTGTGAGSGEISADPLFVDAAGDDLHLQPTSGAIDVALDSSGITGEDRDGILRPTGAGWDMGAYEGPTPEHFAISHDGETETCAVEAITITRHDGSHAIDASYLGTVTIATSSGHGDWSLLTGSGVLVNSGGGSATYSYAAADAGQVVLGFLDTYGEAVDIDLSDGTAVEDFFEDPTLLVTGGAGETLRDDFASVSWGSQDGTLLWTTDWLEVDGAGLGPGTGNARIAGGDLILDDAPNTDLDTAVQRQADLSAHASASFAFDFSTTAGVDASDAVFIEVSDDGGASWSVLERITGISGATAGSRSYDITPFLAANTRVRFRVDGLNGTGGTTCCYGVADEEFRVAFAEIRVPTPVVCGPEHYAISHDGSGVTCQAENVTFTAHDASHGVFPDYTGTITLSTSSGHGDWSLVNGAGVLVNAGGGAGSYSFAVADAGVVVLGLRNTFSETLDIDLSDGTAAEAPSEDPALSFESTGFSFLADGVASTVGTQIGGKPSDVAPGAQLLELEAIRTSDSSGACEAALQGPNDVELSFSCLDPATCGAAQVTVNGTPIGGWTPVSLDFGGAGDSTAPIVIDYPDVGRIQLHARYVLTPSTESLAGSSNPFVVRPFAFEVAASGNPGATGPTGPIFTAAGADFTATLRAVLWQAADDADADGIVDLGASLGDNLAAASYGREAAVETAELSATLLQPAGGTDPGLGGTTSIASFTAGAGSTAAAYYDEVGIIEITGAVADGDYLGIGPAATARITGRTGNVGRFRPDRLEVALDTAPVLATSCIGGGFSYLGESFGYATAPVAGLVARSARSTQTRNYTGAWWKISNASLANRAYAADPGDPGDPVGLDASGIPPAASDPAILDLGDGSGTLTFSLSPPATALRFDRAGRVAPFDAEIALSIDVLDGDGVAYASNPFAFGAPSAGNGMAWSAGKEQRYGRLRLENAVGSELSALPVPLRAEYWTGVGFALHGDDGCSVVPAAQVGITASNPAALATATSPSVANTPLLSGDAGLSFSAPGAGNDGWADITVDLAGAGLPWLGWDWTGDGAGPSFGENPRARITFGIYPGNEPVIFRREIY